MGLDLLPPPRARQRSQIETSIDNNDNNNELQQKQHSNSNRLLFFALARCFSISRSHRFDIIYTQHIVQRFLTHSKKNDL